MKRSVAIAEDSSNVQAGRISKKIKRRQSKEKIRRIFLGRLPKGQVAVEIGVWQGDFSGTILEFIQPELLYLIDPWENVTDSSHTKARVMCSSRVLMKTA